MNRRTAFALASLAGYGLFLFFFMRVDPSRHVGYELDRRKAIQSAREVADRQGIASEGWKAYLRIEGRRQSAYYRARYPDSPANRFLSPVTTSVRLADANDKRSLLVSMGTDGRPLSFTRKEPDFGAKPPPETAASAAREALGLLAGEEVQRFTPLGEATRRDQDLDFKWEALELRGPEASPEVSVLVRGSAVREARTSVNLGNAFTTEHGNRDDGVDYLAFSCVLFTLALVLTGLIYYLIGIVNHQSPHRTTFVLFGFVVLLHTIVLIAGGWEAHVVSDSTQSWIASEASAILLLLLPITLAFWGAGWMLSLRRTPVRALTLDLALRGRLLSKPVGRSLLTGFCLAGVFGALAYAPAVAAVFRDVELRMPDPRWWVRPIPVLSAVDLFSSSSLIWVFAIFAFLYPLVESLVSNRIVARGILLALGGTMLSNWLYEVSVPAALSAGFLLILFCDQVYRRVDLLAVLALSLGSEVAIRAASMWVQPSSTVHYWGYGLAGVLCLFIVGSLVIAVKGRDVSVKEEIEKRQERVLRAGRLNRAERDRLLAEFSVAQRAQAQMLPGSAPELPEFDVAAVCRPAREVGGDLYDYVPLENGRWGFVVADVSGKGVPAALYMTMTKGLLRSVADSDAEPGRIMQELNRHLYENGRRGVFVTMALAVFDPASRSVQCARAGHNPFLVRQANKDRVLWLSPSGIGLGLAAGRLFNRSVSVESIQLEHGDAFILYSDGITEAMNEAGDEYGTERLQSVVCRSDALRAADVRDRVLDDVAAFVGRAPQNDDRTLVVVRVK